MSMKMVGSVLDPADVFNWRLTTYVTVLAVSVVSLVSHVFEITLGLGCEPINNTCFNDKNWNP